MFEPSRSAPWLAPYWEGLEVKELRLPKCSVCGKWEWYPLKTGPTCLDGHYVWIPISAMATVFSFTRVQHAFLPGVRHPYIVGLITPDDAPTCRVVTQLEATDHLAIGARARLMYEYAAPYWTPYYRIEIHR